LLNWKASTDAGWLFVSPGTGSLNPGATKPLSVSVNTSGLLEGTYLGKVTVEEVTNAIPSGVVNVTLNINAFPKIGVNPVSISFSVQVGSGASAPSAVSVTNTGKGTLNWSASGNAGWLKATPMSGSLGSLASEPVLLSVNANGLATGTYTTTLTISDPLASNTSELVTIEMNVKDSGLPIDAPAGQCGLTGFEAVALVLLLRRRTSRCLDGGRS
jgi:BACON domain-containing protein